MRNYKEKINDYNENAKIWLHRCNHYGIKAWEMLGYNSDNTFSDEYGCYISVGCGSGKWSFEEYNKIKESENQWEEFEKHYEKVKPRYRYFLYKFFFEFKKDDYIVVPGGNEFHVFQIESDEVFTYNNNEIKKRLEKINLNSKTINDDDFKFFRKVNPIRVQIPRKGYATGELCSKLKYRGTTLEINNEAADCLRSALYADNPFSLYSNSIQQFKKALFNLLCKINPEQFENLISWYFKKKGADIYDVLPKNYSDKIEKEDADVLAVFEDLKIRFFVQAKSYKGNMDLSNAKNQIEKYVEYHIDNNKNDYTNVMWIICLAESDDKIQNLNELKNSKIRVINGMDFAEMLLQIGLQNIDDVM